MIQAVMLDALTNVEKQTDDLIPVTKRADI
jgi:hypothetical protein